MKILKKILQKKNPDQLSCNCHELIKQLDDYVKTLEKEVGYWKEKALNFKKFHQ